MVDEKGKFLLTLNIKKAKDEHGHVYYKQDGQRFDYHCTIKMTVDTSYEFTLFLRPAQQIDSVSVKGSAVTVKEGKCDENSSTYHFDWSSTSVTTTKKKQRDSLPVVLTVHNLGTLTIMLQVKFYKPDDKSHSTWGTALHHIDFECSHKQQQSYVEIVKEVYR